MTRLARFARTVSHLRWEQWAYRPLRALQKRLPAGSPPAGRVARARAATLASELRHWGRDGDVVLSRARAVADGRFRFLGREETLSAIDWNQRHVSHLWSYNLHYFDFALDLARAYEETGDHRLARRFEELALSWIDGTTPGKGDGWDAYPISLRSVNWIYSLLLFGDALTEPARARIEESLRMQLGFLERRLELHILANHLQKNLKALAVGGLYFEGAAADRWSGRFTGRLWSELLEQVLEDGVHYERSPMYHAIALADFLEVVALRRAAGPAVPAAVEVRLRSMVEAFGVLSRPDGSLHLFNDAANGIAPSRGWISRLAERAIGRAVPEPRGIIRLPRGGYHGYLRPSSGERLVIDCGEIGPAYQPGHAHCDVLSFELDVAGRPVVVDSGVSGYADDPLREYARSTRAHNTVQVGDTEQAEVWGTFRVGGRPTILSADQSGSSGTYRFEGAYRPFGSRATHRRVIDRMTDGWRVTDTVTGAGNAIVTSYLHLHPDLAPEPATAGGAWVSDRCDSISSSPVHEPWS
jgi:uncharacterized heparinase superfamily protein